MDDLAQVRRMFDLLPWGVAVVDGDALWINAAAARMLGYERDRLTSLDIYMQQLLVGTTDDVAATPFTIDDLRELAYSSSIKTVSVTRGDGMRRWIEHEGRSSQLGSLWMLRDVTEQIAAQRLQRRQTNLLERVSRLADVGGWEVNRDTNA
jgi:PAS domain S-box-containing protein